MINSNNGVVAILLRSFNDNLRMATQQRPLAICRSCDWVVRVPDLDADESAVCPRCNSGLGPGRVRSPQTAAAWATAALLALIMALLFTFLRFEAHGIEHSIVLWNAPLALLEDGYAALAVIVALAIIVLPAVFLAGMLYIAASRAVDRQLPGARWAAYGLVWLRPWLMADVFVVGVLVSLIKIVTLADIALGPSFFAFCGYALLVLEATRVSGVQAFWQQLGMSSAQLRLVPGRAAAGQGACACRVCGEVVHRHAGQRCPTCGIRQRRGAFHRLQWTIALLISAGVLLIPANLLPIMETANLGYDTQATIIGGIRQLVQFGSWPIAIVIFFASLVIPIAKILILGWLCYSVRTQGSTDARRRLSIYRFTELIGRWSMIDVFVVAVLTALIQAGSFMAVQPGPGAVAFAAVVILTMLATVTFDPRVLWQSDGRTAEQGR